MTEKDIIEILLTQNRRTKLWLTDQLGRSSQTFCRYFGIFRDKSFKSKEVAKMIDLLGYEIQVVKKGEQPPYMGYIVEYPEDEEHDG